MTGLTAVFTFHYAKSSTKLAHSASDPYLLPLPNGDLDILALGTNPHVLDRSSRISTIVLKVVEFQSPQGSIPSGLGQTYFESGVVFYQLSLLTNDLALLECLYAEIRNDFKAELRRPYTISRLGIAKTPAKVFSGFIVPNGYVDPEDEDLPQNRTAEGELDTNERASDPVLHKDPCTINFEWLNNEIHDALTGAAPITDFQESLDIVQSKIDVKLAATVPTVETLYVEFNGPKKAARTYPFFIGFAY